MRIAFTRTTEIKNTRPYLQTLWRLFEDYNIQAKLFYTSGECSLQDFPGESEKIHVETSATELSEHLRRWGAGGFISLSVPDENALRDAVAGEILATHQIPSVVHPAKVTQTLANKWETKLLLEKFGLATPSGLLIDGDLLNGRGTPTPAYRELTLLNGDKIGYPLLTKPLWDCLGNGIKFHHDHDALNSFLDSPYDGNVILEKCISGELFSIEIIGKDGLFLFQPLLWKGETGPKPSLYYNEVRHSVINTEIEKSFEKIKDQLVSLCDHLGINGTIEVEMILYQDKFHIIEINPRVSGTTVLSIAASGINTFEALMHMSLGSWEDFESTARKVPQRNRFSLQFPFEEIKQLPHVIGNLEIVQLTSFKSGDVTYSSAIVSGDYRDLSKLNQNVELQFHVKAETMERIEKIQLLKWKSFAELQA